MKPLTKSQQKVLDYLKIRSQEGISPSVREICEATGFSSTSTIHAHLKTLEERGLIIKEKGLNRSIRIAGERSVPVPVIGKVTAGAPIFATEDVDGYIHINESIHRGRDLFALKVNGDSMINAGILDGDIVVVNKTPVANNGQIVVALVGDEATVKRFYKEKGHYRLQPDNNDYEPIVVEECTILGTLAALVRKY